jgi:hypothetical protein
MVKHDIEAYLDGSLGQAEAAQFEEEMRRNPDFAQEVAVQRKVVQHLQGQLLREHVASVLAPKPRDRALVWWWLFLGAVLLAGGFWVWGSSQASNIPTAPAPMAPSAVEPDTLPNRPEQKSPKPAATKPKPIAELPAPHSPGPNVRGLNEENTAWKTKLDKIWQKGFPPAAVNFGPGFRSEAELIEKRDIAQAFVFLEMKERKQDRNDTLRFLKGYCLLELAEGAEALKYFEGLEQRQPEWKPSLQWYRGYGHLLLSDAKKAKSIYKEISTSPSHPYREQAGRVLEILK